MSKCWLSPGPSPLQEASSAPDRVLALQSSRSAERGRGTLDRQCPPTIAPAGGTTETNAVRKEEVCEMENKRFRDQTHTQFLLVSALCRSLWCSCFPTPCWKFFTVASVALNSASVAKGRTGRKSQIYHDQY